MTSEYTFHPQLIVRLPLRPYDEAISDVTLHASLQDAQFSEALYLASPVLHAECTRWLRGELIDARKCARLRSALTRYYVRATSRCTPFGLFAGCAVAQWGQHSRVVPELARTTRHTRLDMHYQCALVQRLATYDAIRPHLRYWVNSSLYEWGEEFRYIDYYYAEGQRINQLSAVAATPYLRRVLAAAPAGPTYSTLLSALMAETTDPAEAAQYLDSLIDAQVLVAELEPNVTGTPFFDRLLAVLTRLQYQAPTPETTAVLAVLVDVKAQLATLDQQPINAPAAYERLLATLAALQVAPEAGKLLQTDTTPGLAEPPVLAATWQPELLQALEVLACLAPAAPPTRLDDFRARFEARYEEREVPLLEALDNESGISYTAYGQSSFSELVQDLVVPASEAPAPAARLTPPQNLLRQRLRQAARDHQYSLDLSLAEMQVGAPPRLPLPPSLGILFRVVSDGQLLLEPSGGASAVNLLGRFAHANPAVACLISEITQCEQAHNPAVSFAEICHLPVSRVGNLLARPHFRALEIPYLSHSTLPAAAQVRVQDLLLSVRQGQLELRSRVTGQRIMPRLGTAHNFAHEALPVYQFLCDLQSQGLHVQLTLDVSAGASNAKFCPRLTCQRVVLAPATWHLEAADLHALLTTQATERTTQWRLFCQDWQLPRFFVLADGDNELLVDADNELLVTAWLDAVRDQASVQLKEWLFDPATSPARDAAGRPYVQQWLALLLRQGPSYPATRPAFQLPPNPGPRAFAPGSEWLYYKLYCGQKTADYVLQHHVAPLVQQLGAQGLIDNWFFVRYADPDAHLRLRLHLPVPNQIGVVMQLVGAGLPPLSGQSPIWKIQLDTYQREVERYGSHTMVLTETLFGLQSQAVLPILGAPDSWLWGLAAMAELLDACGLALPHKIALLTQLRAAFAQEFALDKHLQLQLDAKYRHARSAIEQAVGAMEEAGPSTPLHALGQHLAQLEAQQKLEVVYDQLLGSYLHMLLNRLLPTQPRLHELVLYDFLLRYYRSQQARRGSA
jgi:thiopeptide-type bacteriocin biosynthesis protein